MRIAIVKLSALGDIVHAMVVLQFIKKFNQDILIDWFVEESFRALLEFNPDINKVHLVNIRNAKKHKSLVALISEFQKVRKLESYDLVIDMQGLIKSAIISKLIPSKLIVGFDKLSVREKFAATLYNKTFKYAYEANIIHRNVALIEHALGLNVGVNEIKDKVSFLYSGNQKLAITLSTSKKNIVLIPGASNVTKRYPVSKFVEITKLIEANYYIIWGSKEEEILANKIKESVPEVTVCKKFQLESLILLISKVDLVIGPDTGPTHLSWALNVPSITLFGPTPGYRNSCVTMINRVIESNSKVNPMQIDKKDFSIQNIEAKDICLIAKELLEK
jgi:heptosyltransferase I